MANKFSALIAQEPVNKGLDFALVDEVIRNVVAKHFPEIVAIERLVHERHKRRVGKRNSTFIYGYYVYGKDIKGQPIQKHLIYSSHSDGSRFKAFTILRVLNDAGFNNDLYRVIQPLEYISDIQTMIYEAVPGKTLLSFLEQATTIEKMDPLMNTVARWIRKFHGFKLPANAVANIPEFDLRDMNWHAEEFLAAVDEINKQQSEKLDSFFRALTKLERSIRPAVLPGIVYGDLHPENIIIEKLDSSGLTMIDFTDVTRGDQLRDIGSFIQQMTFMGRAFYRSSDLNMLRTNFISHYFQKPFDDIGLEELQRINMYQAWNSLRGFVYFFFQEGSREQSYGLLEDAWLYLTCAIEKSKRISIYE